jgi:hypothetical protein
MFTAYPGKNETLYGAFGVEALDRPVEKAGKRAPRGRQTLANLHARVKAQLSYAFSVSTRG